MQKPGLKRKVRLAATWISLALLFQFVLMNISAALYAYKLTHLYTPAKETWTKPVSKNIFARTWRLFTGPAFYKQTLTGSPPFSFSTVILKTKDSISLEAWYGKTDNISKGTVILFHGLMGHKGLVIDEAAAFRNLGYSVMMVDVRDHGNSRGSITTIGYKESEDVKLAYDHITELGEKNIFLWGFSLGAVEIVKAVSDYDLHPSGIIIESPFLSLQSHLKGRARTLDFPAQPFGLLTSFWIGVENGFNGWGFRTDKYAKNVHCSVLMQCGKNDELVLPYETNSIYESIASDNKKLVVYENGGHESFLKNDPVKWISEMKFFLK
jgi:uncharacterized protein